MRHGSGHRRKARFAGFEHKRRPRVCKGSGALALVLCQHENKRGQSKRATLPARAAATANGKTCLQHQAGHAIGIQCRVDRKTPIARRKHLEPGMACSRRRNHDIDPHPILKPRQRFACTQRNASRIRQPHRNQNVRVLIRARLLKQRAARKGFDPQGTERRPQHRKSRPHEQRDLRSDQPGIIPLDPPCILVNQKIAIMRSIGQVIDHRKPPGCRAQQALLGRRPCIVIDDGKVCTFTPDAEQSLERGRAARRDCTPAVTLCKRRNHVPRLGIRQKQNVRAPLTKPVGKRKAAHSMSTANCAGRIEPNCYPVRFSQKRDPPIGNPQVHAAGIIYRFKGTPFQAARAGRNNLHGQWQTCGYGEGNKFSLRNVCIIQARMGSSRLPGKILMPLAGRAALDWVVARTQASRAFAEIVLATTTDPKDDPLVQHGAKLGLRVVRGSETDVLDRYRLAADESRADIITRVTSDCPLIEPAILAAMAARCHPPRDFDIISNAVQRTFPRGLDAEMFTRAALEAAATEARDPAEREHVTVFIYRRPERFRIAQVTQDTDHSRERWTLDTPEDYALLSRIFEAATDPLTIDQQGVLALLDANPSWRALNAHIEQKKT